MSDATAELALQTRLGAGAVIEDESEMTDRYRAVLVQTMMIAADLEVATLPADLGPMLAAPSIADRIAVAAALQDEMGHAQVMFRMLEDFGYDTYELLFERDPAAFKSFYLLEWPYEDPIDMAMAQVVGDRAGYTTTLDLERHCSFGPYSRSLRKVNFEEQFHVKRGEHCIRYYMTLGPDVRTPGPGIARLLVPPWRRVVRRHRRRQVAHGPVALPDPRPYQRSTAPAVARRCGPVLRGGGAHGAGALRR
jgi:ring-1,2-phenylacetyl-CoA epoxidase subunit PaaA